MHFEFPEGEISPDTLKDTGTTSHHCEAGCYQCLLSYFNQPDHELIDRRNPEMLRFLCALSNASVTGTSLLQAPRLNEADPLTEWLATLERLGLRKPDKLRIPINGGAVTADALYSATRALVFLNPPTPEAESYAADRGHTVIVFPQDSLQWKTVFTEHSAVFGNSSHSL
jgi:hypothetical protein